MTNRRPVLLVASAALLATTLFGCSKSAKDLQEQWTRNESAANGFATRYPDFKAVITKRIASATAAYQASQKAKGDDKLEQMKAAISMLNTAYGPLGTYEARVARIARLKRSRWVLRNPARLVRPAFDFANLKLSAAASALHASGPAVAMADMQARAQRANALLSDALTPLRRLERRGRPKTTVVVRKRRRKRR
ncbi:MAG: hypothetical protein KC503_32040 [Myxococcales bacterium]|nr:hypothetical protein [Myxococcales bacterium]